eukprot:CAMPEP_0115839322 /NCGR_PEP_ID=MMETSP0287-20121206/6193_1 /TAXON_ID=412157 /ORGANISM="Chrysochromulina rotalis, Strain UIO044" /LENGTH=32 /DNA_ID= /DNA_START= /DNA_END= /DNA_ORIENTATION=
MNVAGMRAGCAHVGIDSLLGIYGGTAVRWVPL